MIKKRITVIVLLLILSTSTLYVLATSVKNDKMKARIKDFDCYIDNNVDVSKLDDKNIDKLREYCEMQNHIYEIVESNTEPDERELLDWARQNHPYYKMLEEKIRLDDQINGVLNAITIQ